MYLYFEYKQHGPQVLIFHIILHLFQNSRVQYLLENIYGGFNENSVVSDIVPFPHLLVGEELWVAEAQHALIQTTPTNTSQSSRPWSLEVLPGGIWAEGLCDVLRFSERRVALIQEREGNAVRERPLQQPIVLSWQNTNVD